MTTYAFDPSTRSLIATWATGVGHAATTVHRVPELPEGVQGRTEQADVGLILALELTRMSEAAWRTYTDADRLDRSAQEGTDAWRLAETRAAFPWCLKSIAEPLRGAWFRPHLPIRAHAHEIGRVLTLLADDALRAAVLANATVDLKAVQAADQGDLSGRAAQAISLTRLPATPVQVQAAYDLIYADPLECLDALATTVEPTAACVAALAWLRAAAQVGAGRDDATDWVYTVKQADDIEPMPVRTATSALRALSSERAPADVVTLLLRQAKDYAAGHCVPFPGAEGQPDRCVLDPMRPAPNLLEDLVAGIGGCYLVWLETTLEREPELVEPVEDGDGVEVREGPLMARFADEVRALMGGRGGSVI